MSNGEFCPKCRKYYGEESWHCICGAAQIRDYNIDYNKPEEAARTTINLHRDALISLRNRTGKREELEWEIRVYDYMLLDPVTRLDAYNNVRYGESHIPRDKRIVIQELGWVIP